MNLLDVCALSNLDTYTTLTPQMSQINITGYISVILYLGNSMYHELPLL